LKKGSTGAKEYHFYFPRSLYNEAAVSKDQNPHHWTFCLQHNDELLNGYNAAIILTWMANINTLPVTSISVIVNYINKYCSKEEKKSISYQKLLQSVQLHANSLYAFSSVVAKFINKLIAKHNWLVQEVCHLFFNIPLCEGSKNIVTLDCQQEDN